MTSLKDYYDDETLRMFTEEERERLLKLHQELDAKYIEIGALLAPKLGLSGDRLHDAVQEAIDQWDEDDVDEVKGVTPATPLEHLLAAHHEIAEKITDIRDDLAARRADAPEH